MKFKKPLFPNKLPVDNLSGQLHYEVVNLKKMEFVFLREIRFNNELKALCASRIHAFAGRSIVKGKKLFELLDRLLKGDKEVRWPDIWLCVVQEDCMKKNQITR
jgi:hypothetical protein